MATPIIIFLRFMWRFRGLLVIAFLIILGHIWLNDAIRAWDSWRQPQAYCDDDHLIRYIPADQCRGFSSCDRRFDRGETSCPGGSPFVLPTPTENKR
ncbi:MAG: hypothetical protein ACLQBA_12920 [Candidatus Binataceae bacterium]